MKTIAKIFKLLVFVTWLAGWGLAAASLHVVRERLEGRHVERVQAARRRCAAEARGAEVGQRGQEAGERLVRPGVGDQQRVPPPIARREYRRLMPPHAPAARAEPCLDLGRDRGVRHGQGERGASRSLHQNSAMRERVRQGQGSGSRSRNRPCWRTSAPSSGWASSSVNKNLPQPISRCSIVSRPGASQRGRRSRSGPASTK